MLKICKSCGIEYQETGKNQKFCGNFKDIKSCSYKNTMFISKRTKDGKLRKYNYRKHRKVLLEKSNNKCILCDNRENLAIDHIVPKCVGGSNKIENLRILCTTCNNREYQKLVNEALVFYFKNK